MGQTIAQTENTVDKELDFNGNDRKTAEIPKLTNSHAPGDRVHECRNWTVYIARTPDSAVIHLKFDHQNFRWISFGGRLHVALKDSRGQVEFSKEVSLDDSHRDTKPDIIFDIPITVANFDRASSIAFALGHIKCSDLR
jgi:hypothetical protein